MYDVYTPEKVATFETYVKETLGEDNKVLPWVKNYKRHLAVKNYYLTQN